ncbi:hypothetical protein [Myxacorys almedinensis]|uniref:Uncharacterized protein n=1 Tax=Myxacorys almedinensis A TaxID=2690445 RepID=A0A8J7YYP5_9CYAN|nr:hypothetical protein [Myxacorys almedinensis]NDJ17052.1 hypothetical protein [Myxacorys almedinensis A]
MNSAAFQAGKDKPPIFRPSQIVYLEHGLTRLYAEVVQFVEIRCQCWVRPLALVSQSDRFIDWTDCNRLALQDLRDGSDLMCPAVLFKLALDTDVIPLLSWLYSLDANPDLKAKAKPASQQLHQFIHIIWQAHPEVFSSKQAR